MVNYRLQSYTFCLYPNNGISSMFTFVGPDPYYEYGSTTLVKDQTMPDPNIKLTN